TILWVPLLARPAVLFPAAERLLGATLLPAPVTTSATGRSLSSGRKRMARCIAQFGNHRQRMRVISRTRLSHDVSRVIDFQRRQATSATVVTAQNLNLNAAMRVEGRESRVESQNSGP